MTLTGNQIRQKFLDYFLSKNHKLVKSAPLIPQNDPTLYFTNAGMVPFKNYFTGQEKPESPRATSSQKCMRVSGKHNDLENVGRTARHHTFFEMLGNFSFGDYFKNEAIAFAWEFLTVELKMPIDKLWITIFDDDDEAGRIWHEEVGVAKDRIIKLGTKDNFWSMGDTGPCGPCSEIHFDQEIPCSLGNKNCAMGTCDCDRFLEIWNLVFMQYERHADGSRTDLPKPSIDTGMGLERLTALLQNKKSNYDCDLFTPLLTQIQKIVQKKYGANDENDISMRVIADHIRAAVFLISDGVLPSNEGRGYVLRRILRRAIRHGKLLGQTQAFFFRIVPTVVNEMGHAYPELKTNQETIEKVIQAEEERFFETLEKGLKVLAVEIEALKKSKQDTVSGSVAFKLYDTFGFPLDLTEIIAAEHQLKIDQNGFEVCMTEQKERARAGWKGSGESAANQVYFDLSETHSTEFLGYSQTEAEATVLALIQDQKIVSEVTKGDFEFVTNKTPFYAESGGQVGDHGFIYNQNMKAQINDTQKPVEGLFVHKAKLVSGSLKVDQKVELKVDKQRRQAIMRNHSATHLMHAALRKILGTHVRQSGSYVDANLLRFDFSHFEGISKETLLEIETAVNQVILSNVAITKNEMDHAQAIEAGALAFFGDKYGDKVRVVAMGDYSVELCGGTHLEKTSEIGFFKIISEGSIAAGVRRIEAITGSKAIEVAQSHAETINTIAASLKAQPEELTAKVEKLKERIKSLEKETAKLKNQILQSGSSELMKDVFEVNGVKALVHQAQDAASMRDVAQTIKDKIKSGVTIVTAQAGPKAMIVVSVTDDLSAKYPANKILADLAPLINGRGGGKADMAQAGGTDISGLKKVEAQLKEFLAS